MIVTLNTIGNTVETGIVVEPLRMSVVIVVEAVVSEREGVREPAVVGRGVGDDWAEATCRRRRRVSSDQTTAGMMDGMDRDAIMGQGWRWWWWWWWRRGGRKGTGTGRRQTGRERLSIGHQSTRGFFVRSDWTVDRQPDRHSRTEPSSLSTASCSSHQNYHRQPTYLLSFIFILSRRTDTSARQPP